MFLTAGVLAAWRKEIGVATYEQPQYQFSEITLYTWFVQICGRIQMFPRFYDISWEMTYEFVAFEASFLGFTVLQIDLGVPC